MPEMETLLQMLEMKGFHYIGSSSPSGKTLLYCALSNVSYKHQDTLSINYIIFLEIHHVHLRNCSIIMLLGRPDLERWSSSVGLYSDAWVCSDPVTGLGSVQGSCQIRQASCGELDCKTAQNKKPGSSLYQWAE